LGFVVAVGVDVVFGFAATFGLAVALGFGTAFGFATTFALAVAFGFGTTFGFDRRGASLTFALELLRFGFGLRDLRLPATFGS
jgi:hypothetical protein